MSTSWSKLACLLRELIIWLSSFAPKSVIKHYHHIVNSTPSYVQETIDPQGEDRGNSQCSFQYFDNWGYQGIKRHWWQYYNEHIHILYYYPVIEIFMFSLTLFPQLFASSLGPQITQKFSIDQLIEIGLPLAWVDIIITICTKICHQTCFHHHHSVDSAPSYVQETIDPQGEDGGNSENSFEHIDDWRNQGIYELETLDSVLLWLWVWWWQ